MDTSPGARLFNTWTTAMQIAISSELNTWNTWFTGKGIWCGQELIMWRGEYLTLYSPVIYDCAEVKRLPFRVM